MSSDDLEKQDWSPRSSAERLLMALKMHGALTSAQLSGLWQGFADSSEELCATTKQYLESLPSLTLKKRQHKEVRHADRGAYS